MKMDKDRHKIKILVADDSELIRDRIIQVLAMENFETFEAETGEEVLQVATQVYPDLILLDVVLPDINGVEICGKLRSMDNFPFVPILMLTVKASAYDISNAFKNGASDYIRKPFIAEELLLRIKLHLKNLKLQRYFTSTTRLLNQLEIFGNKDFRDLINQINHVKTQLSESSLGFPSGMISQFDNLEREAEQAFMRFKSIVKI